MRTPKPTPEDPKVVAAREAEQRRAETARTEETQALLMGATQRRLRRTGRLGTGGGAAASGGNVSLIAPVPTMPASGGGASFGGGGGSLGGGGDRFLSSFDTALY